MIVGNRTWKKTNIYTREKCPPIILISTRLTNGEPGAGDALPLAGESLFLTPLYQTHPSQPTTPALDPPLDPPPLNQTHSPLNQTHSPLDLNADGGFVGN